MKNKKANANQAISSSQKSGSAKKAETPILDALRNSLENPSVPLHIPGHAGGKGILPEFKELFGEKVATLDATDEFGGIGKLHPADGAIALAQDLMAELFGAEKSFFLINGSSVGNLALAMTAAKENQKIIVGRNCHRSVISGLTFSGGNPAWVVPQWLEEWGVWGQVTSDSIEKLLDENPEAAAVWLTNPTYEGVISDMEGIASLCKSINVPLIVDEAHGCLWKFNDKFPKSALECGADAVVHSLHKTGGSFSQSSVLHVGKDSKINPEELEANLRMLQSTSPSCTLLASLDAARAYLSTEDGLHRVDEAIKNAEAVRKMLGQIDNVHCLSANQHINIDPTKIYLTIDGFSGRRLQSILEIEYNIEIETATDEGILALSNIGNSSEELYYFCECIKKISQKDYLDISHLEKTKFIPLHIPEMVCKPRKAYISAKEQVIPEESIGRISTEIIAFCPPGIPVLIPGEKITEDHLPYLINRQSVQVVKTY